MKKFIILALLFCTSFSMMGQTDGYKKWVLLEHFTNTRCGICGNANGPFFNRWSAFPDDIRHISYHPSFPYQSCAIYQSNPAENTKRANFYNVPATPYVMKNGKQGSSAGSTSTMVLNNLVGGTSPILVTVAESGSDTRKVDVTITTHPNATVPTGSYQLFVAAVEKEYNYAAPNGEDLHHNVFRTMVIDGVPISIPNPNDKLLESGTYEIDSEWMSDEIYTIAWVQEVNSLEIANSGSSLDPSTSSASALYEGEVQIAPNPAYDFFEIKFADALSGKAKLIDLLGKELITQEFEAQDTWRFDVSTLPKGVYLVRAETEEGFLTKRVLVTE